jgi:ABC-2 type transport system permease protein
VSGYVAIFSARFRTLLQYRAAAIAGLTTQVFWGFIRVMIFTAFYASSSETQPLSVSQVITYTWLSQAMFRMLPWGVDPELRSMIGSGSVAYEMLRPLNVYTLWLTRGLANHAAPTLLRAVPMLPAALLLFGMQPPASAAAFAAWLASLCAALLLSATISTLMAILMLWTISGEGIGRLMMIAMGVLSGMFIPLPLFPDWAQGVLAVLPFRGLVDIPHRLYMGDLPPSALPGLLLFQGGWILAYMAAGRWLLAMGSKRLVVQGG